MRGVIAGGMVSALEHHGLLDAFDILCGSSAGAFACAYFGAGQAALGTRIYAENLSGGRFIGLHRALLGRPMMRLDHLVDTVITAIKRLDTDALLQHPARLVITATDATTGEPVLLQDFADGAAVRNALRASCRVPLVAGPPVVIGGRALLDGAASAPLPLAAAIAAGATHILGLTTRSLFTPDREAPDRTERMIAQLLRRAYGQAFSDGYLRRIPDYARSRGQLRRGGAPDATGGIVPMRGISIPSGPALSRACRDPARLREGAQLGFDAVEAVLLPQ